MSWSSVIAPLRLVDEGHKLRAKLGESPRSFIVRQALSELFCLLYKSLDSTVKRSPPFVINAHFNRLTCSARDAASQDVRGGVRHLKQSSERVAAIGFCMGGALSILAATHVPELDAVCCWYGIPPPEAGDPRAIRVPIQGHFALKDEYFPPSVVDDLEAKLKEAGVRYEFYRYPASHGFGRESAPYYDPEAAALAWQRSLDFLARYCPIAHTE